MMEYISIIYYGLSLVIGVGIFYQLVNNKKLSKVKKIILGILAGILVLALYPVSLLFGDINMKGELEEWSFNNENLLTTVSSLKQGNTSKGKQLFRLQTLDLNTGKIVSRTATSDLNKISDFKKENNFITENNLSTAFTANDIILQNKLRLRMLGSSRNQIQKFENNIFVNLSTDSSLTFFNGTFLRNGFSINPIELTGPKSVMVASKLNSGDLVSNLISRVSLENGKAIWQKNILNTVTKVEYIKWTTLINETLIIVTNQQVMALNIQDGGIKWLVDF